MEQASCVKSLGTCIDDQAMTIMPIPCFTTQVERLAMSTSNLESPNGFQVFKRSGSRISPPLQNL